MNFNSQIATTREQSEQLLALGLKPETADCFLLQINDGDWDNYETQAFASYMDREKMLTMESIFPSWSLSRLLEMMPLFFRKVIHIQIMPPVVSYWDAGLREFARVYDSSDIYENIISMIAWLISNGYFNTEYLKGETK
jgi:hypothetical protein|nr:MAG TPA: hypothetical protein [Caudoviricetes sp.]